MYNHKILKKLLVLSLVSILSFAALLSPSITYASEKSVENTNAMNIITQTDDKVIYEIEKDDEKLRYEEDIKHNKNKTKIQTKVYKKENKGSFKLIDNFTTEIIENDTLNSIEIIQSGETIPLIIPEIDISDSPKMSTLAYSSWQVSKSPGINLGYRKDYTSGKAEAKYSTMLRSNLSISNKKFDEFAKDIDSLKTWESALIFDATIIGLIEAGLKLKNGITWAAMLSLGKKFIAPVATLYNAFNWLLVYNSATDKFPDLGGTKTTICNYSC